MCQGYHLNCCRSRRAESRLRRKTHRCVGECRWTKWRRVTQQVVRHRIWQLQKIRNSPLSTSYNNHCLPRSHRRRMYQGWRRSCCRSRCRKGYGKNAETRWWSALYTQDTWIRMCKLQKQHARYCFFWLLQKERKLSTERLQNVKCTDCSPESRFGQIDRSWRRLLSPQMRGMYGFQKQPSTGKRPRQDKTLR